MVYNSTQFNKKEINIKNIITTLCDTFNQISIINIIKGHLLVT